MAGEHRKMLLWKREITFHPLKREMTSNHGKCAKKFWQGWGATLKKFETDGLICKLEGKLNSLYWCEGQNGLRTFREVKILQHLQERELDRDLFLSE